MPATAGSERQEEDRQLFDLDKHRSQSRQQLLSCRGQIAMKQKAKRRAELCRAEIDPLPESTPNLQSSRPNVSHTHTPHNTHHTPRTEQHRREDRGQRRQLAWEELL